MLQKAVVVSGLPLLYSTQGRFAGLTCTWTFSFLSHKYQPVHWELLFPAHDLAALSHYQHTSSTLGVGSSFRTQALVVSEHDSFAQYAAMAIDSSCSSQVPPSVVSCSRSRRSSVVCCWNAVRPSVRPPQIFCRSRKRHTTQTQTHRKEK